MSDYCSAWTCVFKKHKYKNCKIEPIETLDTLWDQTLRLFSEWNSYESPKKYLHSNQKDRFLPNSYLDSENYRYGFATTRKRGRILDTGLCPITQIRNRTVSLVNKSNMSSDSLSEIVESFSLNTCLIEFLRSQKSVGTYFNEFDLNFPL